MRPQPVSAGWQANRRLTLTPVARHCRWLLPVLVALSACTYDSAEELLSQAPPAPACDSLAVTFAASVAPLLQQRCVSCHNTALRNGDVSLETYAQVQRVATDGRLVGVITHAQGYPPMPQNGPKLSDCEIARIRQWVRSGMPNN
ncbi:Cytochrome C oxidase, cbb3-type, subunit III [Hymenobacter gelipurpurascens]|uniref:Cytochrome C oxidase, cbb3-type, subunit III n=1 Tax=Hymenobacter gelipurpurascens TaxID=89968 RepID=A0A212UAX3_9BACT|nr:Cytochrome C oxidase, cbb3-type, subunit III [Hymenobacter gelipurpurascens]